MFDLQRLRQQLPESIIPARESARVDIIAQELLNAPDALWGLMQEAGQRLAQEAAIRAHGKSILVCCGAGNNGGDGYIAAHQLARSGHSVSLFAASPPRSKLCQRAAAQAQEAGLRIEEDLWTSEPLGLIVDALLGAGQKGPLRKEMAELCQTLQKSGIPILSCDVASGYADPQGLRPSWVLAMQCRKQENRAYPEIVADLGIPPAAWLALHPAYLQDFPALSCSAHKGEQGHLLVCGGGTFPGALAFACRFALRSGCDLVSAWTGQGPELPASIMVSRQPGKILEVDQSGALKDAIRKASAVLIGPGIGKNPTAQAAARQALSLAWEMGRPCILDADALGACQSLLTNMPETAPATLLTPHLREMQDLLPQQELNPALVHAFAQPQRVVLLKGRYDLLSDGQQWLWHEGGNPRLCMGGSGDSLAGLSAGLMARGLPPLTAAGIALYWFCHAADHCWQAMGPCYHLDEVETQLSTSLRQLLLAQGSIWPPCQ